AGTGGAQGRGSGKATTREAWGRRCAERQGATVMTKPIDQHGSFIAEGPRYSVLQCRGPVSYRQQLARQRGCCSYVEQHLNAAGSVAPNYSMAIIGPGCERSRAMAREYTRFCAEEFGIRDGGVLVGHRGHGNVANAGCPHFLAEPG